MYHPPRTYVVQIADWSVHFTTQALASNSREGHSRTMQALASNSREGHSRTTQALASNSREGHSRTSAASYLAATEPSQTYQCLAKPIK